MKKHKSSFDVLTSRLGNIERTSASVAIQSTEAASKVNYALLQVERLKQKLFNKCGEITGVPLSEDENIIDIIIRLFVTIGISISSNDINSFLLPSRTFAKIKL